MLRFKGNMELLLYSERQIYNMNVTLTLKAELKVQSLQLCMNWAIYLNNLQASVMISFV